VKLAGSNPGTRVGKMGLQEIRKLLFPISRYFPRCDKRRKRDDRRLFFFFVRPFTILRFFQRSPAARSHFLKRGPTRCVGGTFQRHLVLSLDKSHIPPVSPLPRSRYFRRRRDLVIFVLLFFVCRIL